MNGALARVALTQQVAAQVGFAPGRVGRANERVGGQFLGQACGDGVGRVVEEVVAGDDGRGEVETPAAAEEGVGGRRYLLRRLHHAADGQGRDIQLPRR